MIKYLVSSKKSSTFAADLEKSGAIAQLVEQRTENPCVPGSIPGGTTAKKAKQRKNPDFQRKSGFFLIATLYFKFIHLGSQYTILIYSISRQLSP